jgi:hypothetical protein
VTHEGGELKQPRRRVDALPIPAQQAAHREGVPQAVKPGRCDAVGDGEGQLGNEPVEDLACGAGVHAAAMVETEQRRIGCCGSLGSSALDLGGEEFADARPVRDEAALAELAAAHDEQLPVGVHVAEAQAARLPGS